MRAVTAQIAILPLLIACGPKASKDFAAANLVEAKQLQPIGALPMASGPAQGEEGPSIEVQSEDINRDGDPDIFYVYKRDETGSNLIRVEIDLNWDGQIDMRTTFNPATQMRESEEMDGDFDGTVDWVDHYQGGKRTLSEVDTNYDGTFDLFKIYESGSVRRKERDTNFDGTIDFWEYLDDQGNVTKVGRDIDGDGVMDIRED